MYFLNSAHLVSTCIPTGIGAEGARWCEGMKQGRQRKSVLQCIPTQIAVAHAPQRAQARTCFREAGVDAKMATTAIMIGGACCNHTELAHA